MAKTMRMALASAAVAKEQVGYIDAHGSSTQLGDKYETAAIKDVLGNCASGIPVSSSKSMIGHTVGASGAIEATITMMSMLNGVLTPTINYTPDPELDLDDVPNDARACDVNIALSNAFAIGGCNATLVFRQYAEGRPA